MPEKSQFPFVQRYWCRSCDFIAESAPQSIQHHDATGHFLTHREPNAVPAAPPVTETPHMNDEDECFMQTGRRMSPMIPVKRRNSMILYLAGPMSGIPDHNFPMFDRVAGLLRDLGHGVVSPADVNRKHGYSEANDEFVAGTIDPKEYAKLFKLDVQEILGCEGMVMLPGWVKSKGAKLEFALARMVDMPCYRYNFDFGILEPLPIDIRAIIHIESDNVDWR